MTKPTVAECMERIAKLEASLAITDCEVAKEILSLRTVITDLEDTLKFVKEAIAEEKAKRDAKPAPKAPPADATTFADFAAASAAAKQMRGRVSRNPNGDGFIVYQ